MPVLGSAIHVEASGEWLDLAHLFAPITDEAIARFAGRSIADD